MDVNLNEITLKDIAALPTYVKAIILSIFFF